MRRSMSPGSTATISSHASPSRNSGRFWAAKTRGALALDRACRLHAPPLVVLFSSLAGVTGNSGQADYACANAFLDAFAQSRSAAGSPHVVAIDWPIGRTAACVSTMSRWLRSTTERARRRWRQTRDAGALRGARLRAAAGSGVVGRSCAASPKPAPAKGPRLSRNRGAWPSIHARRRAASAHGRKNQGAAGGNDRARSGSYRRE